MPEKIAFVGVGRMGSNMARRLKEKGFEITAVYDVHRETATALAAELGCAAPETLPEVTSDAEVVITVVTDDNSMDEIFSAPSTGRDSLLTTAHGVAVAEGTLFINCATVSPDRLLVEPAGVRGQPRRYPAVGGGACGAGAGLCRASVWRLRSPAWRRARAAAG